MQLIEGLLLPSGLTAIPERTSACFLATYVTRLSGHYALPLERRRRKSVPNAVLRNVSPSNDKPYQLKVKRPGKARTCVVVTSGGTNIFR